MIPYFEATINIIKEAFESLEQDSYYRLVNDCKTAFLSGKKIIASGLGKNVSCCEKFVGTLHSLGIDSAFLHTNSAAHGDIGMVKPGDVVLLLTKSGNTKESIYLAEQIAERECTLWLISFDCNGCLSKTISNKILMHLSHEGDSWNLVPNNSSTIFLMLLQGLAITISKELIIPLSTFKENHPAGYIGELLGGL